MTRDEILALLPTPRNTFRTPVATSGYFAGLNEGEADFMRHAHRFGTPNCVSRLGRGWVIWSGLTGHGMFKTKREAVAMADTYLEIVQGRWYAAKRA